MILVLLDIKSLRMICCELRVKVGLSPRRIRQDIMSIHRAQLMESHFIMTGRVQMRQKYSICQIMVREIFSVIWL